jgi:hypothetical protein
VLAGESGGLSVAWAAIESGERVRGGDPGLPRSRIGDEADIALANAALAGFGLLAGYRGTA